MKKLSRRRFIVVSASAAALMAASQYFPIITLPDRKALAQTVTRTAEEKWIPSVCLQCPAGCGIMVRTVNGRAVKIEGNPLHPINQGNLCPKGLSGLQFLYDPDRIRAPLKRAGKRGEGKWQEISWNEAVSGVASHLKELRERGDPHKLIFLSGRNRGQAGPTIGRFLAAYGSPNDVGHSSICEDGSPMGHWATQGWKAYAGYDWDNTNYLLCFGAGFIEAWRPTTRLLRAFGHMRRGRPVRAKIVVIDPRLSVSAAKADEWIPIRPATDGALALGIAHVIVKEGLYDANFVKERTFGFDDWTDSNGHKHTGWKTLLGKYPPEWAANITGVPADTITRLAREFAATKPAIAAGARGKSMQTNGVYNSMAIHALNALVGSFESPGGVIRQIDPPLKGFPGVVQDQIAKTGANRPRADLAGTSRYPLAGKVYQMLPENILNKDPYEVDTIMFYYTNPLFSTPNTDRFWDAFDKVPFIVSFSPFMDESTSMSDYVLPDHSYLERWHDDVIYPSLGYSVVGLRQPVVNPLYNTQNAMDSLIQIAKGIGGTVAESFPWNSFEELLKFRYNGIYEAKRGTIIANGFDEWWEEFKKKGVWADPPYSFGDWGRGFATPSKRFELYSQLLEEKLEHLAEDEAKKNGTKVDDEMEKMIQQLRIKARGDEVFMPHYEPPIFYGEEQDYPLYFVTYKTMTHAEGRGANVPFLQDSFGVILQEHWNVWAEINPLTAAKMGISDGDYVYIESKVGKIRTKARLYEGARPDTVNMPFELGHKSYGRWARGRGVNPNAILYSENDRLGGLAAFSATRVKVYKA